MKYTIKTTPMMDGRIIQEFTREHLGIEETMIRDMLNTKEKQVIQALIELGWRPPDDRH